MDLEAVAEALAFVAEHPHVYLLARRSDGFPTGYAMTARARTREGCVDFSTYRASAKVKNLLRDGTAGIVASDEDPSGGRVLFAEGPLTLLDGAAWTTDEDQPEATGAKLGVDVPAEIVDKVGRRHQDGKRVVLRVRIERARFTRGLGFPS